MKKILILVLCMAFLVLPFVAADTTIKVHALKGYSLNVTLSVTNVNSGVNTDFVENGTDSNGDYYAVYTGSGAIRTFVTIRQDGKIALTKYGNYTANDEIGRASCRERV